MTEYLQIPFPGLIELPPLLISPTRSVELDLYEAAERVSETGFLTNQDSRDFQARAYNSVSFLANAYTGLLNTWRIGTDVMEWTRQCSITFEDIPVLKETFCESDIWPNPRVHLLVELLKEKVVDLNGTDLEVATGLTRTFQVEPPFVSLTPEFMLFLYQTAGRSAYQNWSGTSPPPNLRLPPDKFYFQIPHIDGL
jgi:hypothetical protein